jgi:hypothetical protein
MIAKSAIQTPEILVRDLRVRPYGSTDLPPGLAWQYTKNCRICSTMVKRLLETSSPVAVIHCTQADPH